MLHSTKVYSIHCLKQFNDQSIKLFIAVLSIQFRFFNYIVRHLTDHETYGMLNYYLKFINY